MANKDDNLYNLGKDLTEEVTKAIKNGDFNNLEREIRKSVDTFTKVVSNPDIYKGPYFNGGNTSQGQNNGSNKYTDYKTRYDYDVFDVDSKGNFGTAGHYGNVAYKKPNNSLRVKHGSFMDSFWSGLCFFIAIINGILLAAQGIGSIPQAIVRAIFLLLCGSWGFIFRRRAALARRGKLYSNQIGQADYIKISDLALKCHMDENVVKEDLKKMMKNGWTPGLRIDKQETTLMFTDEAFENYLNAQHAYEASHPEIESTGNDKSKSESGDKDADTKGLDAETKKIVKQGMDYARTIREINDEIPDVEDISQKLYDLEDIMKQIFIQLKKNPSAKNDIEKVMNYYIPTEIKLLNSYVTLFKQPDGITNIEKAKSDIERSVDSINEALKKVLDGMFENIAWDVSSDINVMERMMEQDGLK